VKTGAPDAPVPPLARGSPARYGVAAKRGTLWQSARNNHLAGDYYIKIDNACISENESSGGVVNLESSEPYLYKLEAVNAAGDKTEIEFGASRELRQDAFLKLDLQPIRGVVGWSEVSEDSLPRKVEEALN